MGDDGLPEQVARLAGADAVVQALAQEHHACGEQQREREAQAQVQRWVRAHRDERQRGRLAQRDLRGRVAACELRVDTLHEDLGVAVGEKAGTSWRAVLRTDLEQLGALDRSEGHPAQQLATSHAEGQRRGDLGGNIRIAGKRGVRACQPLAHGGVERQRFVDLVRVADEQRRSGAVGRRQGDGRKHHRARE